MDSRVQKIFDPSVYLDVHYNHLREPDGEQHLFETILVKLHEFIGKVSGGESVLNFGAGPTIHAVISASAKFRKIVFAEYTEANKGELRKWIANSEDKFDWSRFFKYVAVLEGMSESNWHLLEQRVRRAVQDVVHCDARTDPIIEGQIIPFDAIIITLCLEEACTTFEGLKNTVNKLAAMLKPEGHFIIFIVLGETFYKVGDQIIEVTPFTEEQVLEAIAESGLNIKESYKYTRHSRESERKVADYSTMLGILAQKCQ